MEINNNSIHIIKNDKIKKDKDALDKSVEKDVPQVTDFSNPSEYIGRSQVVFSGKRTKNKSTETPHELSKEDCKPLELIESEPISKEDAIKVLKTLTYSDDEIAQIEFDDNNLKKLGGLKTYLELDIMKDCIDDFINEFKTYPSEKKLNFIKEDIPNSIVFMNNKNVEEIQKYFEIEPKDVFDVLDDLYDNKEDTSLMKIIPLNFALNGKMPPNINPLRYITDDNTVNYENMRILKKINEVLPDNKKLGLAQCTNLSKNGDVSQEDVDKYISHLKNFKDLNFVDIASLKTCYDGKDIHELNQIFDNIQEKLKQYPMDLSMEDGKNISRTTLESLLNRKDVENVQKYINSLSKEAKISGINHIPKENEDFEKLKTAQICNLVYSKDYGQIRDEYLFKFLELQKENDYKNIDGIISLMEAYKGTNKLNTPYMQDVLSVANGDYKGAAEAVKKGQQFIKDGLNFNEYTLQGIFANPDADFKNINKMLSFMYDEKINFYDVPNPFFTDKKGYNKLFLLNKLRYDRYNREDVLKIENLAEFLDTQDELDFTLTLSKQSKIAENPEYYEPRLKNEYDDIREIIEMYRKDSDITKRVVEMRDSYNGWRFISKDSIIPVIESYIEDKDLTEDLLNLKTEKGREVISLGTDIKPAFEASKIDKDFAFELLQAKDEFSDRHELRFKPEKVLEIVQASTLDKDYINHLLSLKEKGDYGVEYYRVYKHGHFTSLSKEAQKDRAYVDLLMNSTKDTYEGPIYRFSTDSVIDILNHTTEKNKKFIANMVNARSERYNSYDIQNLAHASEIDLDMTKELLNESYSVNDTKVDRFTSTHEIFELVKSFKKDPEFAKSLLKEYKKQGHYTIPRFDGNDITLLVNLTDKFDKTEIQNLLDMKTAYYYDDTLSPRFGASEVRYLLNLEGENKTFAMDLLNEHKLNKHGQKQYIYNVSDLGYIFQARDINKDYVSQLLKENRLSYQYGSYDILHLTESANVNQKLTDKLRVLKFNHENNEVQRFDSYSIQRIVNTAQNDISDDEIVNLANMTTVTRKGNIRERFSTDNMIQVINSLRKDREFTNKLLQLTTNDNNGNTVPLYNAGQISMLVNNLTYERYKEVQNVIGDVIEQLPAQDICTASDFLDFYQVDELNSVPLERKKELLKSLVATNADLFSSSDVLKENFPLIPTNQEDYCRILPAIVRSIGIETNELNENQINNFNKNLDDLSGVLAKVSDTEFNDLEITQEYSKNDFIKDVVEKLSKADISDTEKQKVFDYYGFELHENPHNPTGYTIVGYPVNLNNGKKLAEIKDVKTKNVVEDLRKNVIHFSENNKISVNNKDIQKLLNEVVDVLPELRTLIGKKQNDSHDFDVMKHSLKVMQKVTQSPKFKDLNESDKKILLLSTLMHDITKAEGLRDATHADESSFDTFFIAKKFKLSKDEEIKLYKLVKYHEWLAFVNTTEDESTRNKLMQSVAFDMQQNNTFDLSYIFTKADLQAVKKEENVTIREYSQLAETTAPKIKEYIADLKKSQPLLPVTKMPKASTIEKAITYVNSDGSTNIKGVYKDKTGLVVVKFNEVEDWEKLGLPKGSTTKGTHVKTFDYVHGEAVEGEAETGNIKFFVHGLDYPNQLAKFDAFALVNSDALLSVSYAERPETKYRFFRPQGIMLDVQSDYVYGGGNTDSGSGCGKNINKFKENYIFGGHRESDRLYISNMVKEATGMNDKEYVKFFEENKDKSMLEIEPEEIRTKLIQKFATINSNHRKGNRAYNEMYISNPKEIMGVFAYDMYDESIDKPLQFLEKNNNRTDFLKKYALEHDVPFYLFGD